MHNTLQGSASYLCPGELFATMASLAGAPSMQGNQSLRGGQENEWMGSGLVNGWGQVLNYHLPCALTTLLTVV
jgi:hypothetical protein